MRKYKYLIVGGGMTADAAVNGIREVDADGAIGLISSEQDAPYDRPPLTKSLWKDKPLDAIWRHTENRGVDLHLGRTATAIDTETRSIIDDQRDSYSYEKLLIATGGAPRHLPFGEEGDIIYYRTLADYRRLREMTEHGQRFAVIGGGFIGSEITASLASNHKDVFMIFPGKGICDRMFPFDLSQFLNSYYRQKGVQVLNGETAASLERRGEQFILKTQSGTMFIVDGVIAGIGIQPNLDLARLAGLTINDGIVVDEFLRSSELDIYAAGDVAVFYNPALERQIRVEHEDNANTMGRIAGRNMAGMNDPYHHLPFFYSDMFDLGYEAVGDVNSRLRVIADWKDPYREGVIYYEYEDRVRGVVLWNVWGQVDAARELIAAKRTLRPEDLKEKLPKMV